MPRYSIIIPVFNAESFIRDCLESIICQSFEDFEVILIDDGSTDASGKICDEYSEKDKRIKVLHKKNEGVSIARNIGLTYAVGDWISFVDADDVILPDYFSAFDQRPVKSDLTYFGNNCIHEDGCNNTYYLSGNIWRGWEEIQKGMILLKQNSANYDYYGYTVNKFFRADIIRKYNIMFIPGITMKEDELFIDDYIIHCDTLETIPDVLYDYRIHSSGLTNSFKSAECLNLYIYHSQKSVSNFTEPELITYQIKYIFNIKIELLERERTILPIIKAIRDMKAFSKRYKPICNYCYYPKGTMAWSIWNHQHSLTAHCFILMNICIRLLKAIIF